ncbi:MAG TPA: Pvc16 family protein [Pyrinomonadaceae bacterium]|nr:Pvc16 family protein [Pyrinomonadaceae bacterium]
MINDLSESLRAMFDDPKLAASFPELAAAQVVFDRPAEQFNPSQPSVNLYLYDVREDMELRSNEPVVRRVDGQALIKRPPLRVACSYLLTAWAVGGGELPLQEQRLLSQALMVLARYPTIPPPFLKGSLIGQEPPLPMVAARADGLKNPAEFWTAVGNKLRPSVTVVVTISLDPFEPETAPLVITSQVRVGERTPAEEQKLQPKTAQDFFYVGGQVRGPDGAPLAGAALALKGTAHKAVADVEGRFSFGPLAKGSYTIRAQAGQAVKELKIVVPAASGSNYNVQF